MSSPAAPLCSCSGCCAAVAVSLATSKRSGRILLLFSSGADDKSKFDELVEDHGVRMLIEPAALMHVIGTTMDFVEDRIKYVSSPQPTLPAVHALLCMRCLLRLCTWGTGIVWEM